MRLSALRSYGMRFAQDKLKVTMFFHGSPAGFPHACEMFCVQDIINARHDA